MITDVLYSVNLYILFCVKRFQLCCGHCAIEVLCIVIIVTVQAGGTHLHLGCSSYTDPHVQPRSHQIIPTHQKITIDKIYYQYNQPP